MRFEFLSEIFDYSVCETRDLSLTILLSKIKQSALLMLIQFYNVDAYSNCVSASMMHIAFNYVTIGF